MMPAPSDELERQIEAAFDFRGHVAIILNDGERLIGYVYNRQFAQPAQRQPPFIEVFLAGSGDRQTIAIETIRSIELTGKNYAAADPSSASSAGLDRQSQQTNSIGEEPSLLGSGRDLGEG